jgi:hypothetical protein
MRWFSQSLAGTLALAAALAAGCTQPRAQPEAVDGRTATNDAAPVDAAPARVLAAAGAGEVAELPVMHVYKTPTCGCCTDWVTHVEEAGFRTEVQDMPSVAPVKQRAGLPRHLASCHTTLIGDYVVEGHVPADVVVRLMRERPEIAGIAVPGMPMGSPGMEGPYTERYDIIAFRLDGSQYVYESR